MGVDNVATKIDQSPEDICYNCRGFCCQLGGIVATKEEVEAIQDQGYPNHFTQLSDDVFGTTWRENGVCRYFTENKCSIYSLRPLGCRMFPVVQTMSGDIIVIECPLASQLPEDELMTRKKILLQRPISIFRSSLKLRIEHYKKLRLRSSKYENHIL